MVWFASPSSRRESRGRKRQGQGGAYLGGHLVYRRGVGVDRADRSPEPRGFQPVAPLETLEEDRPRRVEVWDEAARAFIGVVLVLHHGRVHALGARCSHMGGPLDEGWVQDGGLVCPWHGSRYCLEHGGVMDGPSTAPQPRYETRIVQGVVELRRVPEPGDEALRPEEIAVERQRPQPVPPPGARPADEVLFEHHELLRRLFEGIADISPSSRNARCSSMLNEERASLARRRWRDLKIRLLEGF